LSTVGGLPASMSMLALLAVLLVAMAGTGAFGVLLERIAYNPLRNSSRLAALITAVGASFAMEYGMSLLASPNPQTYPHQFQLSGDQFSVVGARMSPGQLVLICVAFALMAVLSLYVGRTRSGRAMRAIAMDP